MTSVSASETPDEFNQEEGKNGGGGELDGAPSTVSKPACFLPSFLPS